jgi:O-antigen ligase
MTSASRLYVTYLRNTALARDLSWTVVERASVNPIDLIVALVLMAGLLVNRQPLIPIAAMGLILLRGTSTRLLKGIPLKRVEGAIVLCLAYWVANYFWSTRSFSNFISYDFLRRDGAMLFSYGIFIFFLGWPLKPGQCRAFWTVFLLVLSGVAVAGAALALNIPHTDFLRVLQVTGKEEAAGGSDMFFGWYEAHNTAGGVYAIAAVLALLWAQQPELRWKERWFRWGLFGCCLVGLVVSYSRGAYVAFAAGALLVLPIRNLRRTAKIAILVAVPVALLSLMGSTFLERVDTISDPTYGTNAERIDVWEYALKDWGNSPLIGIGFGRYNDLFEQFVGVRGIVWVAYKGIIINDDSHAHNSYLHFLAEGGIVGLIVTMLVWWSAWKELSLFEARFPRSRLRMLAQGARACLVVALVHAFTEHVIGRGSVVLLLDALIGVTLASARLESRELLAKARSAAAALAAQRVQPRREALVAR